MRLVSILTFLVPTVLSCLIICNNKDGCPGKCPCSDPLNFFQFFIFTRDFILEYENIGCIANITCVVHFQTRVTAKWDDSEIIRPDDAYSEYFSSNADVNPYGDGPVDMFSFFGFICENGEWYITKYPNGISYFSSSSTVETIRSPEKYIGKRTKIYEYTCANKNW